ncbi:MAG: histidine--tRNA ligase [Solirubrobacterales bacterium]|nr:histidine--tRNA ligase [Solirubrobacterales bacterium]MCB8969913.1 histidine--tRNA ligase [Thermoleophilales bacterium]
MASFQAPKGTFDVLPEQEAARAAVLAYTERVVGLAGYGRIETPMFEDTALFARGVGEATDIVRKEMFTFEDGGGRSITLRPEGTAPVCRAYLEHGMHRLAQPVKLWYAGSFFRYERPQEGRYRQFNQIGAEAIGSGSPLLDAEVVILLDGILRGLGIDRLKLKLSSLGSTAARMAYRDELREYLRAHESDLSEEVRARIDLNPMRAFDSDHERTRGVMAGAPTLLERLEGEDAEHFAEVRALLDAAGVAYELDPTLVRGLDYYNRTLFEFDCDRLGAQSGVGGGGRYDGLIEMLGGPATPAIGWAAGIERILLAMEAPQPQGSVEAFIVSAEQRERAFALVLELRAAGIGADLDLAGRSFKGQMKQADRSGARAAVILEADGTAKLRDMGSGEQREVDPARIVDEIRAAS